MIVIWWKKRQKDLINELLKTFKFKARFPLRKTVIDTRKTNFSFRKPSKTETIAAPEKGRILRFLNEESNYKTLNEFVLLILYFFSFLLKDNHITLHK